MSRTKRGNKGAGYEFWSRRSGCYQIGKAGKLETKRQERTDNKKLERQAMVDPGEVRGIYSGE